MSADEITLTLPRERPFFAVAHLVLGGLAVRLDLSVDQLEDLRVALDELLGQHETEQDVTLTVRVDDGELETVVGPFDESMTSELERGGDGVGLRRVLETVMDKVEVMERAGRPWVALTKAVT
jgi:serine/threonine-protein kinase RsbW